MAYVKMVNYYIFLATFLVLRLIYNFCMVEWPNNETKAETKGQTSTQTTTQTKARY